MHCVFCAHRAKQGAESPLGRVCETCTLRIAQLTRREDLLASCWGIAVTASALARLVHEEMDALARPPRLQTPAPVSAPVADLIDDVAERNVSVACEHFAAGRGERAVEHLSQALAAASTGPHAERALALLLGPMLKPGGADVLRRALFRT